MATISIDYDSTGDVELILQEQDDENSAKYNLGPLGVKVKEVHLRVSSLKLISSSHYFQAMLEDSEFQEGKELKQNGFLEIELLDPEDDPTAMMIILGILYGKEIRMPNEVGLEMLNRVTVLVDKYHWHALVTSHAISWYDGLLDSLGLPDAFDETLLTWLWIAWVFGIRRRFKALSQVAMQDARKSIDLTDEAIRLPIRALKAINGQRELGFQKISEIIEAFKAKLFAQPAEEEEEVPENVLCRYMALGSVSFVSRDLGLGEFASPDHAGISLRILSQRILHAHSLPKFVVSSGTSRRIPNAGGIYDLKSHLQKAIDDLEMNEWGLEYNDYSPPNNHSRPDKTLDGEECTRTSST